MVLRHGFLALKDKGGRMILLMKDVGSMLGKIFIDHCGRSNSHSACGGLPPMSRTPGANNLLAHNIWPN